MIHPSPWLKSSTATARQAVGWSWRQGRDLVRGPGGWIWVRWAVLFLLSGSVTQATIYNLTSNTIAGTSQQSAVVNGQTIYYALINWNDNLDAYVTTQVTNAGSGYYTALFRSGDDNDAGQAAEAYSYDGDTPLGNLGASIFPELKGGVSSGADILQLSSLPTVTFNGDTFLQYSVDVNESDNLLSVDEFELFIDTVPQTLNNKNPEQSTNAFIANEYSDFASATITTSAGTQPRFYSAFQLDADSLLLQENGSGSGNADVIIAVRKQLLQDIVDDLIADPNYDINPGFVPRVYLYAKTGATGTSLSSSLDFGDNGGFDEFATLEYAVVPPPQIDPVPETSTLLTGALLALLAGGEGWRRRRSASRTPGETAPETAWP